MVVYGTNRPNLAVSHFMVEYGVGLEQVEHPQLTGTQRSREIACTPNTTTSQSLKRLSHEIDFKSFDKNVQNKASAHSPHSHLSTFKGSVSWDGFQKFCQKFKELGKCTPHNHLSTVNSSSDFGEEIPTRDVLRLSKRQDKKYQQVFFHLPVSPIIHSNCIQFVVSFLFFQKSLYTKVHCANNYKYIIWKSFFHDNW